MPHVPFSIKYPGSFLVNGDQEMEMLLSLAESALIDASLSLGGYGQARRRRSEAAARRERLDVFSRQEPFFFARGFLFAVDRLRSVFLQLAAKPTSAAAGKVASDALDAALPHLRDVRNSSAHADERAVGKIKGRPKPVVKGPHFVAPQGGLLSLEVTTGDNFGSTLADGIHAEVPVTPATLTECVRCFQMLINALRWRGEPKEFP